MSILSAIGLAMKGANRIRYGDVIKQNKEKGKADDDNLLEKNSDEEEDQE